MQFSDTSGLTGLLQDCEFWTGLGDGGISGNTTLKKRFTALLNLEFDRLAPSLFPALKRLGWQDTNLSSGPTKKQDLSTLTNAYQFLTDANSLGVFKIAKILILQNSGDTDYVELERKTLDDANAAQYLAPNSDETGIASSFIERNLTAYLDKIPDVNITNGIMAIVNASFDRFLSTDTTQEPGFPSPFHRLLSLGASSKYLARYRSQDKEALATCRSEILVQEPLLNSWIRAQNPTRGGLRPGRHSCE